MSIKRPPNQESESDPQELGFATRAIYSQKKVSDGAERQTAVRLCGWPFDSDAKPSGLHKIADDLSTGPSQILEEKLAELEGAEGGLVMSSALAAFTTLVRSVLSPGDRMITQKSACTATTHLLHSTLSRLGVEMVAIDLSEPSNLRAAIKDRAHLLYVDTPSNPLNALLDIADIADQGHAHGMIVAVDRHICFASLATANRAWRGCCPPLAHEIHQRSWRHSRWRSVLKCRDHRKNAENHPCRSGDDRHCAQCLHLDPARVEDARASHGAAQFHSSRCGPDLGGASGCFLGPLSFPAVPS